MTSSQITTPAPKRMKRNTRRAALAALIGIAATGGVLASAASLGVTGNTLGAGTTVIASCDTDGVALSYGHSYQSSGPLAGRFGTTSVTVNGVAAGCAGKRIDIALTGAGGVQLATGNATLPSTGGPFNQLVTFATAADANLVTGAAVVIAD